MNKFKFDWLILPCVGAIIMLIAWHGLAGRKVFKLTTSPAELSALVLALPQGEAQSKALAPALKSGNR